MQVLHLLGDLRHQLHRAGAGADHRDGLALEVVTVIPARRMEGAALEILQALQLRNLRLVQLAHRRDQHLGLDDLAAAQPDAPQRARLVPVRTQHLAAEAHMAQQVLLARHVAQVVEDLGLLAVAAGPGVVRLEAEGVQVRGHIAGRAGIGVLAPHPAHVPGLLQDGEGIDAGLLQRVPHAQAAETAADDHHAGAVQLRPAQASVRTHLSLLQP